MNCYSEHLVLVGLFPPLVVHGCIAHLANCDYLVSAFTGQNEIPLQASVVIDIRVDNCASKGQRCMMFVTHECAKREHLDVETDLTTVHKTTSFRLLLFHGIFVPSQIILQPLVDAILVNDAKVSQLIIGKRSKMHSQACVHMRLYAMMVMRHCG